MKSRKAYDNAYNSFKQKYKNVERNGSDFFLGEDLDTSNPTNFLTLISRMQDATEENPRLLTLLGKYIDNEDPVTGEPYKDSKGRYRSRENEFSKHTTFSKKQFDDFLHYLHNDGADGQPVNPFRGRVGRNGGTITRATIYNKLDPSKTEDSSFIENYLKDEGSLNELARKLYADLARKPADINEDDWEPDEDTWTPSKDMIDGLQGLK